MKNLTMITRHGVGKEIVAYTLISSDYQTVTMSVKDLANSIANKKIIVNNLDVSKKGIVSTNGALDKYTLINYQTNQVEGKARAVILDRAEQDGKLVGYTVFTQDGTIVEMKVAEAAALANQGLISNGKIRHTSEGDIVSAIGGNYPLRTVELNKAPKGEMVVDVLYFGTVEKSSAEYFGAIVSCTSATEMSKIMRTLNDSNKKVIAEATKAASKNNLANITKSLAINRMGANSLYGVFEVSMLDKLISSGARLSNKIGNMTVSAVKYGASEDSVEEATVKLGKDWKIVSTDFGDSSEDLVSLVKSYTKKIVTKFSSVKVNN